MRLKSFALVLASAATTGCYHVTVTHGIVGVSQGAAPTVVDKGFSHSFVYGLVPPSEMNVKDQCPHGVQKVETEQSFVGGVVAALTNELYTPLHVTVTCK